MIDWIKTVQGIAAIVTVIFATVVAWWNVGLPRLVFSPEAARGAGSPPDRGAREQLNRDTRLLVLDQACWRAHPLGMLRPEMDAAFATSGGGNGGPADRATAPLARRIAANLAVAPRPAGNHRLAKGGRSPRSGTFSPR